MKIVLLEGLGVGEDFLRPHRERLEAAGHTLAAYGRDADPKVQAERMSDADAVILANMPLSEGAVRSAAHLRFIDVAFTGVDHIPMKAAAERGITVSNASGYATDAVAELAVSQMIRLMRHMDECEVRAREGGTKDGLIGHLLRSRTVGIVGAGAIGKRTAQLCAAFGCRVIAYSRSRIDCPCIAEQVTLEELLRESDIVSLHCPLNDATRGLIGERELKMMKNTACLINTARGGVVDSAALAAALREGTVAGAALDVFDREPPLDRDDPLLTAPHVLPTPHIGFFSVESLEDRARIVFDNLYAYLDGHPVNVCTAG